MRRGVTLLEVLVALTILGLGVVPLYDLFRGARGTLAATQDMLLLQSRALQMLAEGNALVAAGGALDLGADEEEVIETEDLGVACRLVISRAEAEAAYRIEVRATHHGRFFRIEGTAADPTASFRREDASELPPEREAPGADEASHDGEPP